MKSMDPGEVKAYIADHEPGTYTLLDVRQPQEYEKAHLPGAKLIPLPFLEESLDQLNPEEPIFVY